MNSVHLHQKIVKQLQRMGMGIRASSVTNLALLSQSLAVSPNCHLSELAVHLPLTNDLEELIQRLSRSLDNAELTWHRSYGQVVRHLFTHWQGEEVALVMDRTDLGQEQSILTVGAAYHKRLLPLAWRILPFGGTGAQVQLSLLRQVQPYLPPLARVRIHYYGDCEFRATSVQNFCCQQHWHWQVGIKSDTYVQLTDGHWRQLSALGVCKGQRRYWQQVSLTKDEPFGPVNLIADWSPNQPFPRFWATDLTADAQAWRRGRKRFWIEPTFRDWKSYGFDLERTQISDPARLHLLILGMALATLWLIHIGDWLTQHGHDHCLQRPQAIDYSYFRLGRDYLQRALTLNWSVPIGFTVSHHA
ncbi:MAG: transposase [Caldilineaceae bacterium]